jgi:hypothetical protein
MVRSVGIKLVYLFFNKRIADATAINEAAINTMLIIVSSIHPPEHSYRQDFQLSIREWSMI